MDDAAGRVEVVAIRPSRSLDPVIVDQADAVAGRGLRGDRYFDGSGSGRRALTLIERSAYDHLRSEGLEVDEPLLRRNLIVTGIDLNGLVGREFTAGPVLCRGTELCHPCNEIQRRTHDGVLRALVGRGGLCAEILSGGTIRTGDPVRPA